MAKLPSEDSHFSEVVTQAFLKLGEVLDEHTNIKFVGIAVVDKDDINHFTSIKTDNVGMLESVLILDKGIGLIRKEYGVKDEVA